jgi:hypothetical protein
VKRRISQLNQGEEPLRQRMLNRLLELVSSQVEVDIAALDRDGCKESESVRATAVKSSNELLLGRCAVTASEARVGVEGDVFTKAVDARRSNAECSVRGKEKTHVRVVWCVRCARVCVCVCACVVCVCV